MSKYLSWAAHIYTAIGLVCAVLIFHGAVDGNHYLVATAILVSTFIDMTDGTFARFAEVRKNIPFIDGTKMDALIDFLNITFLPLVLISVSGWLPDPSWLWVSIAACTGLFNYSTIKTNVHRDGFIYGFPAIYSIFLVYLILMDVTPNPNVLLAVLLSVSVLELLPIRFARPRDALKFRLFFILGGFFWVATLGMMWFTYPEVPQWLFYVSLAYPCIYVFLSIYLDIYARKIRRFVLTE